MLASPDGLTQCRSIGEAYEYDNRFLEIYRRAKPIESTRSLLVPSLSLYEVFKRVSQQRSEDAALRAVAVMEQGSVVDLDRATLWTQDSDFDGLPGVHYYAKR